MGPGPGFEGSLMPESMESALVQAILLSLSRLQTEERMAERDL